MSSNHKRPVKPQQQSKRSSIKCYTFTTAKGYSGASPSRDIPVLPLKSRPLWKKSSGLLSMLTSKILIEPYTPQITDYTEFDDLPETASVIPSYDYVPSTSSNRIYTSGTSTLEYFHKQFPETPKRNSGPSAFEGTFNNLPQSSTRNAAASASKSTYNNQAQSSVGNSGASTSKGTYNQLMQSPKRNSGATAPKVPPNQLPQSSTRNSGCSASKNVINNALQSSDTSICRDEFSQPQKVISKSLGYPWLDLPLISHESLRVTKDISVSAVSQDAAEVVEAEDVVKSTRSPTRHPSTFSHLYRHSGKKRHNQGRAVLLPKKYTVVVPEPPKPGEQEEKAPKPSRFKMMYFRGDLPIRALPTHKGNVLKWTSNIDDLDYNVYLPLFFEGLRYKEEPWCFFARQGCMDLLEKHSSRVFDTAMELVKPIKEAIDTRNKTIIYHTLRIVQKLLCCDHFVGRAIIPHLHSILPILNRLLNDKFTIKETIYGLKEIKPLGEIIDDTLKVMERHGGRDAYLYIKLLVPTYESCGLNKPSSRQ